MKITIKFILFIALLPIHLMVFANNDAPYQPVSTSVQSHPDIKDFYQPYCNKRPTVVEFFSYACPGCSSVEPEFKRYLNSKAKNIVFLRVPVIFNLGWDIAAKMYYTHEQLGITEQLHDLTFLWVQKMVHERKALTHKEVEIFISQILQNPMMTDQIKNKFTLAQYMEIMDSPTVNRDNKNAMRLLSAYNITSTPSVVVNNKYIVTLEKAQTMNTLIDLINKFTTENTSC